MTVKLLSNTNGITKAKKEYDYPAKFTSEIIHNGFFTVDHQWTVKTWNKAAEDLLGVPAKDVIGQNLWEKFAKTIPIHFYKDYHKALLQDIPFHFEEYWPEMGNWYQVITWYYENTLSISFKKNHQAVHTELREQENILHELYKLVTEITNDCLWEWDLRNKEIFWIDGGHRRVFGYPIENALIPQSFWESRLHPDDKIRILTRLRGILEEGATNLWEEEYRFKKADGDYAYVHDRGHIIYEGGEVCRLIGATQDITARKLAQMQLLEMESKLAQERLSRQKEITRAVLVAQERERAAIGKELHDNLNQVLGTAKLYVELAKTDEESREMCLEKSSGYITTVIEEIRRISKSLVPQIMIMGLADSVKALIFDLLRIHPIKITFQEKGMEEMNLDEKLQMAIFRIIQEQLNNIVKHAKATHATISLSRQTSGIILVIADNGQGYDIAEGKEGVGIRNIISRAELYNGSVAIESKLGEGYTLKVLLPMDRQA